MYKKEFDGVLNSKTVPKSVMFYGESTFFIDFYAQKYLQKTPKSSSVLKLYYDEYDFKTALNHLQNSSLFDDANVLIVEIEKKIPKNEAEALILSAQKNQNSFFVLKYHAQDAKEKANIFTAKNSAESVRFFAPEQYEMVGIMKNRCDELGLKITEHAIRHILSTNNNNLEVSVNELEKLSIYENNLDIKTIDKLIQGSSEFNMDDFFYNLLNKKNILEEIKLFFERGENEIFLLNSFQAYIVQLMSFTIYAKLYGKVDSKEILGYKLPAQIEEKRASLAIRLNSKIYHKMLSVLQECEYLIKTTHSKEKELLILSSLIKIQTKIL